MTGTREIHTGVATGGGHWGWLHFSIKCRQHSSGFRPPAPLSRGLNLCRWLDYGRPGRAGAEIPNSRAGSLPLRGACRGVAAVRGGPWLPAGCCWLLLSARSHPGPDLTLCREAYTPKPAASPPWASVSLAATTQDKPLSPEECHEGPERAWMGPGAGEAPQESALSLKGRGKQGPGEPLPGQGSLCPSSALPPKACTSQQPLAHCCAEVTKSTSLMLGESSLGP